MIMSPDRPRARPPPRCSRRDSGARSPAGDHAGPPAPRPGPVTRRGGPRVSLGEPGEGLIGKSSSKTIACRPVSVIQSEPRRMSSRVPELRERQARRGQAGRGRLAVGPPGRPAGCKGDARGDGPGEERRSETVPVQFVQGAAPL